MPGFFLGGKKNQRDIFGLQKEGPRDFLGYVKNSSNFLGRKILKL